MKKFTVLLAVMLISTLAFSQKYAYKNSNSDRVKSDTTITVDNKAFLCGISKNGFIYYIRTSKKGNQYKYYIGKPTKDVFDGKTVWTNSKNEYFLLVINSSGNIGKKKLRKLE